MQLDQDSLEYFPQAFGWLAGVLIIVAFAWNKFHEESNELRSNWKNRVLSQIYLRNLTFRDAYVRALIIYTAILLILFFAIALTGRGLQIAGTQGISDAAWPIFVALLMAGLAPNLPWISQVEPWLRGMMHHRAQITRAVEELFGELVSSSQNYQKLSHAAQRDIFPSQAIEETYVAGNLSNDAHVWIRTGILLNATREVIQRKDVFHRLGGQFINRYKGVFDQIVREYETISDNLKIAEAKEVPEFEKRLESSSVLVQKIYDDAFNFISCALINRPKNIQLPAALDALLFEQGRNEVERQKAQENLEAEADALLVGFFVALVSSMVVFTIASIGEPLAVQTLPSDYAAGWPQLLFLGGNLYSFSTSLVVVGALVFIFFNIRKSRISAGSWYLDTDAPVPSKVSPSAYMRASGLLLLAVVALLLLVDMLNFLAADLRCIDPKAAPGECTGLLQEKLYNFLLRYRMTLLYSFSSVGGGSA